jgi:hypothetical protein
MNWTGIIIWGLAVLLSLLCIIQYPSALGLGSKISAEIAPPGIRKAKFYPENPFLLLIRQGVGGILSLKL